MKSLKSLGTLFILVLSLFIYQKESKAESSFLSTEHKYTLVEPLGFTLKTTEDFIKAFELLTDDQFLVSESDESGRVRLFIAQGSYSKENAKIFCSYNSSDKDQTEWQICLKSVVNSYKASMEKNECYIISRGEKSVAIYKVNCNQ